VLPIASQWWPRAKSFLSDTLETVKDTHHRLVGFETAQDRAPAVDGALSVRGANHEWTVICNGDQAGVQRAIATMKATVLEQTTPTLEEIFIARASRTASGLSQQGS
jgi:hypothetical protein